MEKAYELKRHKLEANYWLFNARRDIVFKLIQKMDNKPDFKILDVGCGGGYLMRFLEKRGFKEIHGIDISDSAIAICKKNGTKNVIVADCIKTRFEDNAFDIITAVDILEHVKNEKAALNEWKRILKKNGRLIIFVPAFNFLWSQHDEICHHYRRYSQSSLINTLKKGNFTVERSSYWNFSLFFPASLVRVFQRIFLKNHKSDQLYELNPFTNKLFIYLLKFENLLLKGLNFSIGLSVFAIARKTELKQKLTARV